MNLIDTISKCRSSVFTSKSKWTSLCKSIGTQKTTHTGNISGPCVTGFVQGKCKTSYTLKEIITCLKTSIYGPPTNCHERLESKSERVTTDIGTTCFKAKTSRYNCGYRLLINNLIAQNIDPKNTQHTNVWINSTSTNKSYYINKMIKKCDTKDTRSLMCSPFCKRNYTKNCPKAIMKYCASTDNLLFSDLCENHKDTTTDQENLLKYYNAQYNYCAKDSNFKTDKCIEVSMYSKLPQTVVDKYTNNLWIPFCKENPDNLQCSCFLKKDSLAQKYDISAECIPGCKNYEQNRAYQPWTVREAFKSQNQCPNVCIETLKVDANVAILDNITMIQHCFENGSDESRENIRKLIQGDIKDQIALHTKIYSLFDLNHLESDDPKYTEIGTKIRVNLINTNKTLNPSVIDFVAKFNKLKTNDSTFIGKINEMTNMNFSGSTVSDLGDKYQNLKNNIISLSSTLKIDLGYIEDNYNGIINDFTKNDDILAKGFISIRLMIDTLDQTKISKLNDLYSKMVNPFDTSATTQEIIDTLRKGLPNDPYDLILNNILTLQGYINTHDDTHNDFYVNFLKTNNQMLDQETHSDQKNQTIIRNFYISYLFLYYMLNPVEYVFARGSTPIPPIPPTPEDPISPIPPTPEDPTDDTQPDPQPDPSEESTSYMFYVKLMSLILLIVIILVFIYLKFIK